MKISGHIVTNTIATDLQARLMRVRNRQPILRAMAEAGVQLTKLAWHDSSARPTPWANKKDGSPATLIKTSRMKRSPRMVRLIGNGGVVFGSDATYYAIHQLGGQTKPHVIRAKTKKALATPFGPRKSVKHPGSKIPARPTFPFYADGSPTPRLIARLGEVIKIKVDGSA